MGGTKHSRTGSISLNAKFLPIHTQATALEQAPGTQATAVTTMQVPWGHPSAAPSKFGALLVHSQLCYYNVMLWGFK